MGLDSAMGARSCFLWDDPILKVHLNDGMDARSSARSDTPLIGFLARQPGFGPAVQSRPHTLFDRLQLKGKARGESPRLAVRGIGVAADNLLACLLSEASLRFLVFAGRGTCELYSRWLKGMTGVGLPNDQIELSTIRQLALGKDVSAVSIWFEALGEYHTAFQIRDRLAKHRYPVTCTVHGLSLHRLLHDEFLRVILADTHPWDSFICTSRGARDALKNIFGSLQSTLGSMHNLKRTFNGRVDVIPLCVDTARFCPGDREKAKRKLGIPPRCTLVLYLGHLSFLKAALFPCLLALSEARDAIIAHDIVFMMAGSSDQGLGADLLQFATLSNLPRNRIVVRTNLSEEDKLLALQAADIFTSPGDSLQESFGLAPVEAMSTGVPQVVSDWDGYRETVEEGVTGFRVPTAMACLDDITSDTGFLLGWEYDHTVLAQSVLIDARKWREAVLVLAKNPELREKMALASRHRAVALFSYKSVREQYNNLWHELLLISRATPGAQQRPEIHLERPRYYQWFQHYSSALVDRDSQVMLGAQAGRRHELSLRMPRMILEAGLADEQTWDEIAKIVGRSEGVRLGTLIDTLATGRSRTVASSQVMCALKFAIIELNRATARNGA